MDTENSPTVNFGCPAHHAPKAQDPYAFYHEWTDAPPISRLAGGRWLVTQHADVLHLLNHPACQRWGVDDTSIGRCLAALAPHTSLHERLLSQFSMRALSNHTAAMEQYATSLLTSLDHRHPIDLMRDYAHPFTFTAICRVLGVPIKDIAELCHMAQDLPYLQALVAPAPYPQRVEAFLDYWRTLMAAPPIESVLMELGTLYPDTDAEFKVQLGLLLLYAGHVNMMNFIGLALLALAHHSEKIEMITDELILSLLRFDSPVQYIPIIASDEIDVHGTSIAAGEEILLAIGSAHRDTKYYQDPHTLNLNDNNNILSFGAGPYRCLGARLAQLQGRIALQQFIAHFPDYRMLENDIVWRTVPMIQRGMTTMPAELTG